MRLQVLVLAGLLGLLHRTLPAQQPPEDEATKLAKATQVADAIFNLQSEIIRPFSPPAAPSGHQ